MKLKDILIFVFHDIKNNKIKNIFTTIESFLISIIILLLFIFCLSYQKNANNILSSYYNSNPNQATANFTISSSNLTKDKFYDIFDLTKKYHSSIKNIKYDINYNINIYCADYNYINNIDIPLIEGTFSNNNANIYLSKSYKDEYETNHGPLTLNQNIACKVTLSDGSIQNKDFIYAGYYEDIEDYYNDFYGYNYICCIDYLEDVCIWGLKIHFNVNDNSFNKNMRQINSLYKKLANKFETLRMNENISSNFLNYNSTIIQEYNKTSLINAIIVGISLILELILIILGILSISNTMNIIIEENSYITNIYKAYGMKQKDYKNIYIIELLIFILIGLFFSSIVSIFLKHILNSPLHFITTRIYKDYLLYINYNIKLFYPFYIPFIIYFVFIITSYIIFSIKIKKTYNKKLTTIKEV